MSDLPNDVSCHFGAAQREDQDARLDPLSRRVSEILTAIDAMPERESELWPSLLQAFHASESEIFLLIAERRRATDGAAP